MSNVIVNDANLLAIGNAIRSKNNTTDTYKPSEMAAAIVNLPTGGGFDMASLNYVEIVAPSIYQEYSTLPDLTPYVDDFSKIVAMYWCGNTGGTVYVYIRGLNGNKITLLLDVYDIRRSDPQFVSPNDQKRFYFLNGNLSGLNICYMDTSIVMSSAFANALVMLYEN